MGLPGLTTGHQSPLAASLGPVLMRTALGKVRSRVVRSALLILRLVQVARQTLQIVAWMRAHARLLTPLTPLVQQARCQKVKLRAALEMSKHALNRSAASLKPIASTTLTVINMVHITRVQGPCARAQPKRLALKTFAAKQQPIANITIAVTMAIRGRTREKLKIAMAVHIQAAMQPHAAQILPLVQRTQSIVHYSQLKSQTRDLLYPVLEMPVLAPLKYAARNYWCVGAASQVANAGTNSS